MSCNPFEPTHTPFRSDKRRIISIQDTPATKYEGLNPSEKEFSLFRIDKDRVVSGQRKCDYLLLRCDDKNAFFIELKGRHILDAVEQIDATIEALKSQLQAYTMHGRIVVTRTNAPDLQSTRYLKLRRALKLRGGSLEQGTKLFSERH